MSENSPDSADCCLSSSPSVSAELKLYRAFVFSVPIFFAFILLFLFYMFYLRRQEVDWSILLMRTTMAHNDEFSRAELGLKKEVREMLPIIIYNKSFSIKDTLCCVCLGDYQAEDRLQQIPACGHTFHMECIDHWLANHSTCPLCRLSVIASSKVHSESPDVNPENSQDQDPPNHESSAHQSSITVAAQPSDSTSGVGGSSPCVTLDIEYQDTANETGEHEDGEGTSECSPKPSDPEKSEETSIEPTSLTCIEPEAVKQIETKSGETESLPNNGGEEGRSSLCDNQGSELKDTGIQTGELAN